MILEWNFMNSWWGCMTWKPVEIFDLEGSFQCLIVMSNCFGRVMPGITQMLLKVTQALDLSMSSVRDKNHAMEEPKT